MQNDKMRNLTDGGFSNAENKNSDKRSDVGGGGDARAARVLFVKVDQKQNNSRKEKIDSIRDKIDIEVEIV